MKPLKTTALLLALAAAMAAGCGSDEEQRTGLPQQSATDLETRLDEVQRRLDNGTLGACQDIGNDSAPNVNAIISGLPQDVDADVRQALQDGFDRLFALSVERCAEIQSQESETEPAPELPAETETLPETETETVPETETETIPEVPPEETPIDPIPPEEGGDEGSGGTSSSPEEDDG